LDHRVGRSHPGGAQEQAAGGGHARGTASARRDLRAALPAAVCRLRGAGIARRWDAVNRAGRLTVLLALAVLACVTACGQPLYVARLGWAEAKILWRREPVREVVNRPGVDADLRERLELVLAAREFARDQLGFHVGKSYTSYAEVGAHEATVHVVSAAYRDRLKSFTWWYPIAGRVPYRGFF